MQRTQEFKYELHIDRIEMIWLSCECSVDAIQLDKKTRTMSAPDKIVRFDLKEKSNIMCSRL